MAGQGSAVKRHKQSEGRRLRNRVTRSQVRSGIKRFLDIIEAKNRDGATDQLRHVTRLIDTAAGKGVYHKNTAARMKSRLHRKLNVLE